MAALLRFLGPVPSFLIFAALVACGGGEPAGPAGHAGDGDDGDDGEPQVPAALAFHTEPTGAVAGEAIAPAVEVEVVDAGGDVVTSSSASVTLSLGTNHGGGTLLGTTAASASGGVVTFDDLSLEATGVGYTLVASSDGLDDGTSAGFEITPAAATGIAFAVEPTDAEGQEPIGPTVEVAVQDAFGNTVTSSAVEVTVALADDPTGGEATLSGTTTVATADGVAVFDDLSVARPGDGFSLEATAGGFSAVESGAFGVHLTFVQTSAGPTHACGVTVPNYAYCWGRNESSQLGDGTTMNSSTPVAVDVSALSTRTFAVVRTGAQHTCGVTTADEAFCWGRNHRGQLGDATETDRSTPAAVDVAALSTQTFAQVSTGISHTCGVTTADEAFCWGYNFFGQLGDGTTTQRLTPVAVDVTGLSSQTVALVSPGGFHTCGVTTADEAFCWGENRFGQLGDGTTSDRHTPVAVDVSGLSTETFAVVSTFAVHTCGVTTADEAFCWGFNFYGQLGDGTTTERHTPVAVDVSALSTRTFALVSPGDSHTCGVTTADEAFCWGYNGQGQLGDGTMTQRLTPVAVDVTGLSSQTFALVGAATSHTCGVTTADEAFCWGANSYGQLGDGTTTNRLTPSRVVH